MFDNLNLTLIHTQPLKSRNLIGCKGREVLGPLNWSNLVVFSPDKLKLEGTHGISLNKKWILKISFLKLKTT